MEDTRMGPRSADDTVINKCQAYFQLLIFTFGHKEHIANLKTGNNIIGRTDESDIIIRDCQVSKRHCTIQIGPSGAFLSDDGSTNGTFVSCEKVGNSPRKLENGDTIHIGQSLLKFMTND
jgi:pSer/pThr/pTyr-binding forkhead associated (FHA) protein